jgi:hypothetical protein
MFAFDRIVREVSPAGNVVGVGIIISQEQRP